MLNNNPYSQKNKSPYSSYRARNQAKTMTQRAIDPSKMTYYGVASDINLARQAGIQGRFVDISKYGDNSKYSDILHAYKKGGNPVILGGAGVNDSLYSRLQKGGANIQRLNGADRYEVQQNARNYYNNSLTAYQKQQARNSAPVYTQTDAKAPGVVAIPKFNFKYDNLSYNDATGKVKQQLDPLYQQAMKNIQATKYQNELDAGQQAASRGLGRSGLAADLQNKVAIAAQGQIAQAEAEKASKSAEMAQAMLERDQSRGDALRQQAYQEYMGNLDAHFRNNETEYGRYRDTIDDSRYGFEQDYRKYQDSLNNDRYYDEQNYQKNRDVVQDKQYQDEKAWREYTFKNMSASEKAQMEWAKAQYGEDAAWRMYQLEYQGELDKSMNQSQLDYYKSGFPTP